MVIDVCAAPGGKTFHAADILKGSGQVISADLTRKKQSGYGKIAVAYLRGM